MRRLFYLFIFLPFYLSCAPTPENVQQNSELPPIYPDYCDVTIPETVSYTHLTLPTNREV